MVTAAAYARSRAFLAAALLVAACWIANVLAFFTTGGAPLFELAVAALQAAVFAGFALRRAQPRTFIALFWIAAALAAIIALGGYAWPWPVFRFAANRLFDLLLLTVTGAAMVQIIETRGPERLEQMRDRLRELQRRVIAAFFRRRISRDLFADPSKPERAPPRS